MPFERLSHQFLRVTARRLVTDKPPGGYAQILLLLLLIHLGLQKDMKIQSQEKMMLIVSCNAIQNPVEID